MSERVTDLNEGFFCTNGAFTVHSGTTKGLAPIGVMAGEITVLFGATSDAIIIDKTLEVAFDLHPTHLICTYGDNLDVQDTLHSSRMSMAKGQRTEALWER